MLTPVNIMGLSLCRFLFVTHSIKIIPCVTCLAHIFEKFSLCVRQNPAWEESQERIPYCLKVHTTPYNAK